MPFCSGVGAWMTRVSWIARIRVVCDSGERTQPTRQPVALPVLEIELITKVRSRIPSNAARQ